jgi:hypothetical protein
MVLAFVIIPGLNTGARYSLVLCNTCVVTVTGSMINSATSFKNKRGHVAHLLNPANGLSKFSIPPELLTIFGPQMTE